MYKMNKIRQHIIQINCLNYNRQCNYIKKKLLSVDFHDIDHIMFLKKVTNNIAGLPVYLKDINIKINESDNNLFNLFCDVDDRSYFKDSKDVRGFIRVNYVKLSNNIYQISVAVKNTPIPIISYININ